MPGPRSNEDTAAYVAALYDQFLSRWETGENPSIEAYCAENPGQAAHLRNHHQEQVEDLLVELLEQGGGEERLEACCLRWPAHAADLRRLASRMRALEGLIDEPQTEVTAAQLEGAQVGRYRVISELGAGTTGRVLRVWDDLLHREVALKLLKRRVGLDLRQPLDQVSARFIEEAQVTSQLDHPAIVPIHELGKADDGQPFFTMKLVKGDEFSRFVDRVGRPSSDWSLLRGLRLIQRAGEALAYAHHKRVIHRDVKPGNIMVGRFGAVYLVDWGLTRVLDADPHAGRITGMPTAGLPTRGVQSVRSPGGAGVELGTKAGTSLGTPYYMSPEQARGDTSMMTPAVDIYGLGAVLYHMLAGEPPYRRSGPNDSVDQMLGRIDAGPPVELGTIAPGIDARLCRIVARAMAHDPDKRYGRMGELLADLTDFIDGGTTLNSNAIGIPEPHLPPAPGWGPFLRQNAVVLFLCAALVFMLGLWWTRIFGPG